MNKTTKEIKSDHWKTDKYKETEKAYRLKNRARINANNRKWKANNKEQIEAYEKVYSQTEAAKKSAIMSFQKRRALKAGLPRTLTTEQWTDICNAWDNKCAYCSSEDKLTQDHIVPLSKKGGLTKENIIPACQSCNSSKGSKNMDEWLLNA